MDPDHGTTFRFRRVLDLLAPPANGLSTDCIGFLAKKIIAHLQFALFAAFAVFRIAAFFYGSLRLIQHVQQFKFRSVEKTIFENLLVACRY